MPRRRVPWWTRPRVRHDIPFTLIPTPEFIMLSPRTTRRAACLGLAFFTVKGLAWLALAAAGFQAVTP